MPKNRVPPRFFLFLWPIIDRLIIISYHIKPLRTDENSIICLELRRYKGRPIMLSDGSKVTAGDRIIELHLNNAWFRKRREVTPIASGLYWEVLQWFAKDLSYLAKQLADGTFGRSITALHGITFLHMGARRLGFQIEELPNALWKRLTQFYLTGLMQIFHPQGRERVKANGKPLEIKGIWLSKAELLRKYGPSHL